MSWFKAKIELRKAGGIFTEVIRYIAAEDETTALEYLISDAYAYRYEPKFIRSCEAVSKEEYEKEAPSHSWSS